MIESLTKEQEKLMDEVRDEWLNSFFSLEFDEEKAKELVDYLYSFTSFKPKIRLVLDSPLALQICCNVFKGSQVDSQVRSQVVSQVRSQVWLQVVSQVLSQVDSQVMSQVWSQVWSQVDSQVRSQVWSQVMSQVRSQVWSQVRSQVWSQVRSQYFYESYHGRCDDLGWISFYDFFSRIGVVKNNKFEKMKELFKCNLFTSIMQDDFYVISRPPVFIKRDDKHRLHCKNDYAIYFKDGYGLHFINGVYFDDELFKKGFKHKTLLPQEIINLSNAEQKAVLIQEYGYENLISKLDNLKVIDEVNDISKVDGKPVKYQVFEFNIGTATVRVVRVEDHSVHKVTCLGVPRQKDTETCKGAIAWTFGMDKEEYKPVMES